MPTIRDRSMVGSETVIVDNLGLIRLIQEVVNPVCHSRIIHIRSKALIFQRGLSSEERAFVLLWWGHLTRQGLQEHREYA